MAELFRNLNIPCEAKIYPHSCAIEESQCSQGTWPGCVDENQSNQDFSTSDINGLLSDYGLDANGIHFQIGGQAKLLFFNIFTSMRYTFLFETNNSNMKSFPSLTVSAAYGI
mgnify:CR=1 FL=1